MRAGLDALAVPGGLEPADSTAGEGARWRVDRLGGGSKRRAIIDRNDRGVVIHDGRQPELRARVAIDADPEDAPQIDAAAVAAKM